MEYTSQALIPGTEIFKKIKKKRGKKKHNLEFPCVYTVCNFPLHKRQTFLKNSCLCAKVKKINTYQAPHSHPQCLQMHFVRNLYFLRKRYLLPILCVSPVSLLFQKALVIKHVLSQLGQSYFYIHQNTAHCYQCIKFHTLRKIKLLIALLVEKMLLYKLSSA